MSEFVFRIPIILTFFGAAVWTFLIAWWRPHWLQQDVRQRLISVIGESLICGLLWGGVLFVTTDNSLISLVGDGLRAGIVWGVLAFLSRSQYSRIMKRDH